MTTRAFEKPRYTTAHFRKLHLYPVKTCAHCGRRFGPKITAKRGLETVQNFAARLACSAVCKGALIAAAHAERRFASERPPPVPAEAALPAPEPFDPRPLVPFTVTEGETLERGDWGKCHKCGGRLNPFGVCGPCKQREVWLSGQGKRRVGYGS